MNTTYFFDGKRLSSTRFTPQVVAPLMMPPATALPTSMTPAITIGATFASGDVVVENEVEESI